MMVLCYRLRLWYTPSNSWSVRSWLICSQHNKFVIPGDNENIKNSTKGLDKERCVKGQLSKPRRLIKMKYRGRVRVRLVQTEGALSLSSKECVQRFKDLRRYLISNTEHINEIEIKQRHKKKLKLSNVMKTKLKLSNAMKTNLKLSNAMKTKLKSSNAMTTKLKLGHAIKKKLKSSNAMKTKLKWSDAVKTKLK